MTHEQHEEHYPVYLKYTFGTGSEDPEFLIADLASLGFESFEERDGELDAYIREDHLSPEIGEIASGKGERKYHLLDTQRILHQNWNAQWESSFKPILIDGFCGVRATFHAPLEKVKHELIIDPKMAFGTGHHETTWMMISEMENVDMNGRKVLDYGAGTGILSILAEKSGATHVDALEIDLQAVENMQLNLELNHCRAVTCLHGDIGKVRNNRYDVILANINRTIILESLDSLHHMIPVGGQILFSGILLSDRKLVTERINRSGLKILHIRKRGEWICIRTEK